MADMLLHQGSRIYPSSRTTSAGSASPTSPKGSSATWFSSSFPRLARKRKQGEEAGVVESVKAASEVFAPVSGEVVEVNSDLADHPALVNEDPQGDGWFFKIKLADPAELTALLDKAAYDALVASLA